MSYSCTVLKLTYLAVRMSIASTVRMLASAAQTLNLLVLLRRPHPSIEVNSSCSNSPLQWRRPHSVKSTTKLWWRTDLVSHFARGSVTYWAGLSRHAALPAPFIRECISMVIHVCAHGTANLTNRGPSELVEERIFHALQVRTRTI